MQATIVNFRRGRHRQNTSQIILKIDSINSIKDTEKVLKKSVTWISSSKKEIKGNITSSHGNKGCVKAVFERGLPGQALGEKVKVE